jgi:SAM-dependent methyltransferase
MRPRTFRTSLVFAALLACAGPAGAQSTTEPYQPKVGQAGKDVVWVPTPAEMVDRMLDLAGVTPKDVVMDLGSGDGRNVIAAAKRGARAVGVEYNPDLVELSKKHAAAAGVADRASFVQGDMYQADFSQATVLALFLLPENLRVLLPKILEMKPGTRIVANTFGFSGWTPDATTRMEEGCRSWCEAMLYVVPAKIDGSWQMPQGRLELLQEFQTFKGTLTANGQTLSVENGAIKVDEIAFTIGPSTYTGRVQGNTIAGTVKTGGKEQRFTAKR